MIDLDKIKSEWLALKIENAALQQKNKELTKQLLESNVVSNQQKLAKNYRIGYMGFFFPFLAWILYMVSHASVALCIVYSVYGIIIGAFDLWYMKFVKKADYTALPTVDALEHATKVVIYQNWATVASIIAAIVILIPLFHQFYLIGDYSMVLGGAIGGIIGGAIGAKKCINNHRLARRMLAELRNINSEE